MSAEGESVDDPVLGRIDWDGDAWIGESAPFTPKHCVVVCVSCDSEDDSPQFEALPPGREAFLRVRADEWSYRLAAARGRVDLYNRTWRRPEEPILDEESFARLIELCSVVVWPGGRLTLSYDDHDRFFGGHSVTADFEANGQLIRASLEG